MCLVSQLQPALKKAQTASGGEDDGVCPTATWPVVVSEHGQGTTEGLSPRQDLPLRKNQRLVSTVCHEEIVSRKRRRRG